MRLERLANMKRGWFVGNFSPTALRTESVEVAIKSYPAGATEAEHHHRLATEITAIVSGEVEMFGSRFVAGDIVVLAPYEKTAFLAVSDATTVVVKVPGVVGDKYLGSAEPR